MYKTILIGEYANYFIHDDGTVWNYDNMVLKQFPLPEPVTHGSAGHPYGYVIGRSGALYMLKGDSATWVKIADNVKHVAAFWEWVVVVFGDNSAGVFQHGKIYAALTGEPSGIQQVAAAHYILIRDSSGAVWQYNWAKTYWRAGTVWQRSAEEMTALKPTKASLPGAATDITTSRVAHSTAIVNGEPYSWCDALGAKYIGLKAATIAPARMTDIWKVPEKITKVRSSDNTTHVITVSGKVFGGGVNDLGEVGNGQKEATVEATGKWPMSTKLIQFPMVEVGRAGEVYVDIFKGNSYGYRGMLLTDKGIIRACGRNKYGLLDNGIYPEQPTDPTKVLEGLWAVDTFRRAVFPEKLVFKTNEEGKAMVAAGTYPPAEPRILVKTIITRFYDDGTEEAEEV
jgi:hypothetical protein